MIDTNSGGGKQWYLDSVYVIRTGDVARAQPPTKVVNNGQKVTWDGRGSKLALTPQPELTQITQVAPDIITAIVNTTQPFFTYTMTCDGFPVIGNSPPIIVVE